jgi:hypothetical protein
MLPLNGMVLHPKSLLTSTQLITIFKERFKPTRFDVITHNIQVFHKGTMLYLDVCINCHS